MSSHGNGPGVPPGQGPVWPMAPGVPDSPQSKEARTIAGVSPDASDGEFVGASPADGKDAMVAAARRRLERVLAAHGASSRESWLVDHELKSALGRLLAAEPARVVGSAATPVRARFVSRDIAVSLYLRKSPLGRVLLGVGHRERMSPGGGASVSGMSGPATARPAAGPQGDPFPAAARHADSPTSAPPSRAKLIAATIAILSAIGLVIEVAYVPFHLQRSRARQVQSSETAAPAPSAPASSAPPTSERASPSAAATTPLRTSPSTESTGMRTAAGSASARTAQPDGTQPQAPAPSRPRSPTDVRPVPSPALAAESIVVEQPQPASPATPRMDPTVRQRLDALVTQWVLRVNSTIEVQRSRGAVQEGPLRWLAQSQLLERAIALDDIAQLLIEARVDDAEPMIDAMPERCAVDPAIPRTELTSSARDDGRLASDLSRAGGGGESRLAVLRQYRSLPLAPGRSDSRTLVSEAIGGPSRNARALALAILLERGVSSVSVLEAVHARIVELVATPAGRAVVAQLAGEQPGGPSLDTQSLRARVARRILEGRGAPMHLIDSTSDATEAMLDRMARRADPQVAPADIESSLATLARAAARDAAPARFDGAMGPLQRMVASLVALEGARVIRNYRRLPDERMRIDAASAQTMQRYGAAHSVLDQAIDVALGILMQDAIALRALERVAPVGTPSAADGSESDAANPLAWTEPTAEALARWPEASRALDEPSAVGSDGRSLLALAEDVQDRAASPADRAIAARLFAKAAREGTESTAASAALGIASLVGRGGGPHAAERHRWESIAAQYAMADSAMRGRSRVRRGASHSGASADSDAASRSALAEAMALCVSGQGRQALDRLQSPTVRALAQRLAAALPGGVEGLESLCSGRTPTSPALDPAVAEQLLAVEAALRDPRSMRWSDDLSLRRGLPLVSVDTASAEVRVRLFTPAPAPGPQ